MAPAHVNGRLLPADTLVEPLELRPEISPFDVEVQHPGVVDEHGERPVGQVGRRLPQDLVEDRAMLLGEVEELEVVLRDLALAGGLAGVLRVRALAAAGRGLGRLSCRLAGGRGAHQVQLRGRRQALYRTLLGRVHQEERLYGRLNLEMNNFSC